MVWVESLESEMALEFKNILPFPDEEHVLVMKSTKVLEKILTTYNRNLEDLSTTKSFQTLREDLQKRFKSQREQLLDRNVKTVKALSYSVFQCAKKKLDAETCTFCFSNFIPWVFQSLATNAAEECFAKSKETKLSSTLKSKVISDWYTVDLAIETIGIYYRFTALLICLVLVAVLVYGYVKSPPQHHQLIKKMKEEDQ